MELTESVMGKYITQPWWDQKIKVLKLITWQSEESRRQRGWYRLN